jgi:IPT/TIG domain
MSEAGSHLIISSLLENVDPDGGYYDDGTPKVIQQFDRGNQATLPDQERIDVWKSHNALADLNLTVNITSGVEEGNADLWGTVQIDPGVALKTIWFVAWGDGSFSMPPDLSAGVLQHVYTALRTVTYITVVTKDMQAGITENFSVGFSAPPPPGPVLASVNPSTAAQNSLVTITGQGFLMGGEGGINGVMFGTSLVNYAGNVTDDSFTTYSGPAPRDGGPVDVKVIAYGGPPDYPEADSNVLPSGFTFLPPVVLDSCEPTTGLAGISLKLIGIRLDHVTSVQWNDPLPSANWTIDSPEQITIHAIPAGSGQISILVNTPDIGSSTLQAGFQYLLPTTTWTVTPNTGPVAGGTSVTLGGMGYTGATSVTIGGASATNITVVDDNTITCTTPAGTAGAADITVSGGDGGTGTLTGGFTYA